ncbi:MAG: GntR family transcriptional regulator [Clostridiales Family XIII bacterium]|jgi:GntR family transcriptional regulator|nr:GntR family transcriptional regulator [Clostridiales Family XIII bacterium]
MNINKSVPIPLYYQLKEILQNDIVKGVYKPGDLIPTEQSLMMQYDLSRTTVRQAVSALVYEGYLSRKKGVGTTVLLRQKTGNATDLPNQIKKSGFHVDTRLLGIELSEGDAVMAEKLKIDEKEPFFIMERIRLGDGIPLVYSRTFIAQKTAPRLRQNIKTASLGFHKYLAAIGRGIKRIERTMAGGIADGRTSEVLQLKKKSFPILIITDFCHDGAGDIVEYTISVVNTNVLQLRETIMVP